MRHGPLWESEATAIYPGAQRSLTGPGSHKEQLQAGPEQAPRSRSARREGGVVPGPPAAPATETQHQSLGFQVKSKTTWAAGHSTQNLPPVELLGSILKGWVLASWETTPWGTGRHSPGCHRPLSQGSLAGATSLPTARIQGLGAVGGGGNDPICLPGEPYDLGH